MMGLNSQFYLFEGLGINSQHRDGLEHDQDASGDGSLERGAGFSEKGAGQDQPTAQISATRPPDDRQCGPDKTEIIGMGHRSRPTGQYGYSHGLTCVKRPHNPIVRNDSNASHLAILKTKGRAARFRDCDRNGNFAGEGARQRI